MFLLYVTKSCNLIICSFEKSVANEGSNVLNSECSSKVKNSNGVRCPEEDLTNRNAALLRKQKFCSLGAKHTMQTLLLHDAQSALPLHSASPLSLLENSGSGCVSWFCWWLCVDSLNELCVEFCSCRPNHAGSSSSEPGPATQLLLKFTVKLQTGGVTRNESKRITFPLPPFPFSCHSCSVWMPNLWMMELSRQLCGKMRRSSRRAQPSSLSSSPLRGLEIHFYLPDVQQLEYIKDCYTAEELCVEAAKKCCE